MLCTVSSERLQLTRAHGLPASLAKCRHATGCSKALDEGGPRVDVVKSRAGSLGGNCFIRKVRISAQANATAVPSSASLFFLHNTHACSCRWPYTCMHIHLFRRKGGKLVSFPCFPGSSWTWKLCEAGSTANVIRWRTRACGMHSKLCPGSRFTLYGPVQYHGGCS